jgi:ABC-2 type transport system ATP-binding protein
MEPEEKIIDAHNLKKNFHGKPAVIDVSLDVAKGEIFGFLGPNGSGKTTTIRMLCGLLTPDGGTGYCLGYDILKEADAIKRQVGYMAQKFSLYEDLSIYENLAFIAQIYGMKNIKQLVSTALKGLGLYERQDQLAGYLSGGWKQRLALAAALLHKPKLLLLDEPTAGVDPKARRDFWDHIHNLSTEGITTLVSTHYMDEAQRCNRLAYIMGGKILVRGTPEEIIYRSKLFTRQAKGPHLQKLASLLRTEKNIDQIISYGQALHISSKNKKALAHIAAKYKEGYQFKPIETSLEDVFINLVESK